MAVLFEVVAAGEKYTDKSGEEKTRWVKMGVVIQRQDGSMSMKLESIPVGWNGWANLWEPKPRDGETRPQKPAATAPRKSAQDDLANIPDDIPF